MKSKKVLAAMMAMAMVTGTFTGIGATEVRADDDVVNLKIYTLIAEQPDQKVVFDALNEYTKEKIGVTVDYAFYGGAFGDKMQVIIASGEEYDACFTSNWINGYNTNVAKGAFVDIKDMLPEVAPKLYEALPEAFWQASTINGGIYGVPNQQIAARMINAVGPKEYMDAAGVDVNSLQTLTDVKDYAQYVYDNFGVKFGGVSVAQAADYCGYEYITDYMSAGVVKTDDESAKVVNLYETEEWMSMLEELKDLSDAGLLDGQNAYDAEYYASSCASKKYSGIFSGTYKPGGAEEYSAGQGYEVACSVPEKASVMSTGSITATMYGISSTSKHPEETLKYLELINTDPYAMNLLSYGIEGKHYEKVSDTVIKPIEGGGYWPGATWALGNVFNTYTLEAQPADVWEQTKTLNDSAAVSPIIGFAFDPEPVKMEIASVGKVVKEYESIVGGELPLEETNAAFVEKLKVAGVDKVIAEMQSQVDAFLAAK